MSKLADFMLRSNRVEQEEITDDDRLWLLQFYEIRATIYPSDKVFPKVIKKPIDFKQAELFSVPTQGSYSYE